MSKFLIGDILGKSDGKQYRIINVYNELYIVIDMLNTELDISALTEEEIIAGVNDGTYSVSADSNNIIVDLDKLSIEKKKEYLRRKMVMQKVMDMYAPFYEELLHKTYKPELIKVYSEAGFNRNQFWRILHRFFKSGMRDSSLIRNTIRQYEKNAIDKVKRGRKNEYVQTGKARTQEDYIAMDKAVDYYLAGKDVSMRKAYDWMNTHYYSNGEGVLAPASMRLSWNQFYNYLNNKVSNEQIDKAKKGSQEQRNNNRLLLSDTLYNNDGPGDVCEVDACEIDFSSVGMLDRSKSPGRCTAYFMIDVYSKCIVAAYVGYEVNSIIGVTNLLLNLADDKQCFCRRYGADFRTADYFPSGFIPRTILLDRGSDFTSKRFSEICVQLGITKKLAPPGTGSMKGNVEQSFHQFMSQLRQSYEGKGLITGEHGSRPHRDAVATVNDFMKHIIAFVFTHNSKYNTSYELSAEQMADRVRPIPAELWKYGCEHKSAPRPMPDLKQYFYSLLTPAKAYISRKGIYVNDTQLYYINDNDSALYKALYAAQNKHVRFECRYDTRDISRLYYVRDNELYCAVLNPEKHANIGAETMTYEERIALIKEYKRLEAEGNVYNDNVRAAALAMNTAIVKNAEAETAAMRGETKAIDKDMKQVRLIEKEEQKKQNTITKRLEAEGVTAALPKPVESEPEPVRQEQDDDIEFDFDALEDEAFYKMVGYEGK